MGLIKSNFFNKKMVYLFLIQFFLSISILPPLKASSELDVIIPPEIKNDSLYDMIYQTAKNESIKTILEIGSSSGTGSTEAFVLGILENPSQPILFCMEISRTRFESLVCRYSHLPFVKCYNVSSVPIQDFPSKGRLKRFYCKYPTTLNQYPLTRVLSWLKQDIDYILSSGVPQYGIDLIKAENNINCFDMVLIDGSEFTGEAELKRIYGSKYIFLDDINAFKNYFNYLNLVLDLNYDLIKVDLNLRNGYAVFKKKSEVW